MLHVYEMIEVCSSQSFVADFFELLVNGAYDLKPHWT